MKSAAECIPCVLKQVLVTSQMVTQDEWLLRKVLLDLVRALPDVDLDRSPAELNFDCLGKLLGLLGTPDPYQAERARENEQMLALEATYRGRIRQAKDPLEMATRLAIAGNAADNLHAASVDVPARVEAAFAKPLAINDWSPYHRAIEKARTILYLLDNAGEIVLDKLLVEEFLARGKTVTAVVRHAPILADVTAEDAAAVKLPCPVVTTGVAMLGAPLVHCSSAFKRLFTESEVILSKGQANFETLEGTHANSFFLFVTKCAVAAAHLKVAPGDPVLLRRGEARRISARRKAVAISVASPGDAAPDSRTTPRS